LAVLQGRDRRLARGEAAVPDIDAAIADGSGQHGLDIKALVDAFLVVGGDAVGGQGFDVVDSQGLLDFLGPGEGGGAGMA
jgi:hypothetical protein